MKKIINTISVVLSVFLLLICGVACRQTEDSSNSALEPTLTISDKNLQIVLGDEYRIRIESREYRNEILTWTSSQSETVSVEDGIIYAKKLGVSTITVKADDGATAICEVTVSLGEMLPEIDFEFNYEDTITVSMQEKLNLQAYVKFNGKIYTDTENTFEIVNQSIGMVNEECVFIPSAVGQTFVTVITNWRDVDSSLLTRTFLIKVI